MIQTNILRKIEQLFETLDEEFIQGMFIENTNKDKVKISGIVTMKF